MTTATATWEEVAAHLAPARCYWLSTVDASGAPHAVPVWGVVAAGAVHLYTSRGSAKARHVAADPRVALHLESAEDVVIVDGRLEDLGHPSEHPGVLRALEEKYSQPDDAAYLPSGDPSYDVLYRLVPGRARLWSLADFEDSQRRWRAR